jgi:hypothetical protein
MPKVPFSSKRSEGDKQFDKFPKQAKELVK